MSKNIVRLTESDLHRIVKESVNKILMESEPDLYYELAHQDGKLDTSSPYILVRSPKMLKDMGYDENGMKNGKKYYHKLLNPNWSFNTDKNFNAVHYALGDNKEAERDIADAEIQQQQKDARWQNSADKRPLHRKGSLNRAV